MKQLTDDVLQLRSSNVMLATLRAAAGQDMSANDVLEQRVSFAFGSINSESDITKEEVREIVRRQEGIAAAARG